MGGQHGQKAAAIKRTAKENDLAVSTLRRILSHDLEKARTLAAADPGFAWPLSGVAFDVLKHARTVAKKGGQKNP